MTDLEAASSAPPDVTLNGGTLLQSKDDEFADLAHTLSVEDLLDAGKFLTAVSKVSSVRVGLVAYEVRQQTADGEWGRRVHDLAREWEVSERTIHRWMSGAQAHFGLELTPAQKNAQAAAAADDTSEELPEEPPLWEGNEDDELGEAGFDLDGDPVAGEHPMLDWMNDEAGWASDDAPKIQRGTPEDAPAPEGIAMILEPDDTWVAFTAKGIQQEHENYTDVAAERSAKARWARKLEEEPLDLLEDLEMIYSAVGETLPDETIMALHHADEQKAIKPDEVTEGKAKKPRGPKSRKLAYDVAERLIADMRSLHEMCFKGLRDGEGGVTDKEVAGMLPHLQLMPHAISGLTKMAKEAKERALADMSIEDKVAATVAAEVDDDEDPGF